jgi:uncharacterized protein YbjT (DUF2867 family)
MTRSCASKKSQALAARGAEVVKADINDPATLKAAFEDANVVFAASDFWGLYGDPADNGKATCC